jgi:hypothetical protein
MASQQPQSQPKSAISVTHSFCPGPGSIRGPRVLVGGPPTSPAMSELGKLACGPHAGTRQRRVLPVRARGRVRSPQSDLIQPNQTNSRAKVPFKCSGPESFRGRIFLANRMLQGLGKPPDSRPRSRIFPAIPAYSSLFPDKFFAAYRSQNPIESLPTLP